MLVKRLFIGFAVLFSFTYRAYAEIPFSQFDIKTVHHLSIAGKPLYSGSSASGEALIAAFRTDDEKHPVVAWTDTQMYVGEEADKWFDFLEHEYLKKNLSKTV